VRILPRIGLYALVSTVLFCSSATPAEKRKVSLSSRLGVAIQKSAFTCLYTHNAELSAGSSLTLVLLSQPQSTIKAEVVKPASTTTCPSIDSTDATLSAYEIRALETGLVPSMPVIAISGPVGEFRKEGNSVTGDINQDHRSEYFRSCTSGEGVHLTVWLAKPLHGKPKWHQYYYLGYDVESNCSPSETQGP
jgi:hypothetical protein